MSSWRQRSRVAAPTSSAVLTICTARGDDPRVVSGTTRVIPEDDPRSSARTTFAGRRAGTVSPMRSLLARARSLDPARADALLALAFLVESSLEVLLAVPGHAPHRGLVHAGLVVAAGAVALRRRLPLATVVVAWALFVGESALPTVYMDHLVSPFFVLLFLVYSAGRHLDDRLLLPVG